MMFSLSLAVLLLCTFGIHGNTIERGYPFGKLRLAEEGKNEELIATVNTEKIPLNQDQPLPSPCIGTSSSTKIAYPKDKTKYIQCRDEFHYEIFTCPNNGEYNEQTKVCDATIPIVDRCEQEKPCLNDGQCTLLSDSTFKCICRADWTGDRCETPINSCVNKPCGPNADCRTLKTTDYDQDYVCVCHATQSYGLNCQETVQNPCLVTSEQFFPFEFSQRAYIQCDGDLIYFQPCGPSLYWTQDDKICDRKRPPKVDLTALIAKLVAKKNEEEKESQKETIDEEISLTGKTVETEQQSSLIKNTKENEKISAFQPARVATRQQFQLNANSQQGQLSQNEQQTEQLSIQLPQSVETNQNRQGFISSVKQWPNRQVESTVRHIPSTQIGQNIQQQGASSLSEASSINSNLGQFQTKQEFPQQNQGSGSQQWLNQVPDVKTQNNQRFGSQSQSWQGSQTAQNQPQFQGFQNSNVQGDSQSWQNQPDSTLTMNQLPQTTTFNTQNTQTFGSKPQSWQSSQLNQNQQSSFETPKATQNVVSLQDFQNSNAQLQDQSWQNKPKTQLTGFNTQNTQTFGSQPQSWQSSQLAQNQQPLIEKPTPAQNVVPSQDFQNSNAQVQDLSWQNKPKTQLTGFNTQNTQTFGSQPQSWQSSQLNQNQQPMIEKPTATQNVVPLQGLQNSNAQLQDQSWQNKPKTPSSGFQPVTFNTQNTQTFGSQPQSWQNSQLTQNQQPLIEKPTATQNVAPLQSFQNSNAQVQDLSWQYKPNIQSTGFNTQNTQTFGSQPQSWQSTQLTQNQQPLIEKPTPTQNVVPLQDFQNSNVQLQDQSWQNKPKTQSTGYQSTGFQTQNTQTFGSQPQAWQNPKTMPKQQQLTPTNFEGLSFDNKNRLNTGIYQNNQYGLEQQNAQIQQSWQNKGNNQIRQNSLQPESSLIDIQQIPLNNEQTQQVSSTGLKTNQIQNYPQTNRPFGSQQWLDQVPDVKTQNNQRFGSQPQSWQATQPNQNFVQTTAPGQNQYQGLQNQNIQGQAQPWQNKLNTQQIQTQGDKLPSNTIFAFQPKQWPETSKQTQINPSSEIQTTQFGVNQQQGGLSSQSKDSDDFKVQANQNFGARPTAETSILNKGIQQGMNLQGSNTWQPSRPVEQTTEQRKTQDSIPTLSSGLWKPRL